MESISEEIFFNRCCQFKYLISKILLHDLFPFLARMFEACRLFYISSTYLYFSGVKEADKI